MEAFDAAQEPDRTWTVSAPDGSSMLVVALWYEPESLSICRRGDDGEVESVTDPAEMLAVLVGMILDQDDRLEELELELHLLSDEAN